MRRTLFFAALVALGGCQDREEYDATGVFEANTVTVSAETKGKIVALDVEEGDVIKAGQQVGMVDTVLLSLQRKQIQSQQLSAEKSSPDVAAQAAALRTQIAHQQEERDRVARLLADGAATQKQYDDATAQLNILRGELEGLLSRLDNNRGAISESVLALQYQKEQVEEEIRRSRIVAPCSGTVLLKYAEEGEYTMPGRAIFKMANLEEVYLRSYFTVSQLAQVSIGQPVTVIADFGDVTYEYPGKIIWIAEESEFTPKAIQVRHERGNLVYAVKIAVKNDGRLKIGQFGEVRL